MKMLSKNQQAIRKEVLIEATSARAFQAFTERMDQWWPREHHIGKADMKKVVLEPRVGGRWYEVGVDGSECNWGKVLVWDPPLRLVLAWQIRPVAAFRGPGTGDWQYDPDFVTEVEMNFKAEGPNQTRFSLEHRDLDKFGSNAPEMWKALDSEGGWTAHLKAFAAAAEAVNE